MVIVDIYKRKVKKIGKKGQKKLLCDEQRWVSVCTNWKA